MARIGDESALSTGQDVTGRVSNPEDSLPGSNDRQEKVRSTTKTPKSVATRKRIMDAASDIMRERASTDFQMSEVSERCNMSKGSLYYYFADREELVEAVFTVVFEETVEVLEKICSQSVSARAALRGLCHEIASRLNSGGLFALAVTSELASTSGEVLAMASERLARIINLVSAQLESGKSEGLVRESIDTKLGAANLVGGFLMISVAANDLGYGADREGLVRSFVELSLHGVGVEGARL